MLASLAITVLRWSVVAYLLACVLFFSAKADDSPDAEVRDFALPKLEASLKTMPAGPERDYFHGCVGEPGRKDRRVDSIAGERFAGDEENESSAGSGGARGVSQRLFEDLQVRGRGAGL